MRNKGKPIIPSGSKPITSTPATVMGFPNMSSNTKVKSSNSPFKVNLRK